MILSILILTQPKTANFLARIQNILEPQAQRRLGAVEILYDPDPRKTTGEKRNNILSRATGEYIVFVDDDDIVPSFYVEEILKAAQSNPDCITFRGWMTTDGKHRVNFILRMGEKYEERNGIYYRFPNHITPIKRSIALSVKFPHQTQQEDFQWANTINTRGLIKSEVFIDKEMYHYEFRSKK